MNIMDTGGFQQFCYEEYKRTHSSVDDIYRRYPLHVTVVVVLATVTVKLGSNSYWGHFLARVDVTLYYLAIMSALCSLTLATAFMMFGILPRTFEQIGSTLSYHRWRESYRAQLQQLNQYSEDETDQIVARATASTITQRLAEAVDGNSKELRGRLRLVNWSTYS